VDSVIKLEGKRTYPLQPRMSLESLIERDNAVRWGDAEIRRPETSRTRLSKMTQLVLERNEYLRYPAMHFSSDEQQLQAIHNIDQEIELLPGGKWKLTLLRKQERQAIQSVIDRVHSAASAIRTLRSHIAYIKIAAAWKKHVAHWDALNTHYNFKNLCMFDTEV